MSLIHDINADLSNLPEILANYEAALNDAPAHLSVTGKIIETALKEQAAWPVFYDSRKSELKTLLKFIDSRVSSIRGKLYRQYTENYTYKLGERALNAYIDAEPTYLNMYQLYLMCEDLHGKYEAVVQAFDKRGFALRDITQLRIKEVQDAVL